MQLPTTRRSPSTGLDPSGGKLGWYPEEIISLEDALKGFTFNPAYGAFLEGKAGVIDVGAASGYRYISGRSRLQSCSDTRYSVQNENGSLNLATLGKLIVGTRLLNIYPHDINLFPCRCERTKRYAARHEPSAYLAAYAAYQTFF